MSKHNNEKKQSPWGKRKLIFLLLSMVCILVVTNIWSFYFKNHGTDQIDSSNDKYKLLNPARKFTNPKDLIINFQSIRDYLNGKYEADQNVSIYFEYLPTGANISIGKDARFYPASMLKVPVAMGVAKKIDKGVWRWNNKLVLMASDKDDKFGSLHKEQTGSIFTIEELVKRSLVDSDNTAHSIILRNMENTEISDVNRHIGLDGFMENDGSISAKRYSVVLRALYNSSYLSEESSQKIISFLSEKKFREYLGSGLPDSTVFAHKIGIEANKKVYMDSGIIYFENRPYILTVMTKSKTEQQAKDTMKDISEKIFNYVKNFKE